MDLLVNERYSQKPDCTIGKILLKGSFECYVLEDEIRAVKVPRETAIPAERYLLGHRYSPKFSKHFLWSESARRLVPNPKIYSISKTDMLLFGSVKDWKEHSLIWIKDIPYFEFVRIHWGNIDTETDGCLLVGQVLGTYKGKEAVLQSKAAYRSLYEKAFPEIAKGGQYITIKNPTL